MKSLAVVVVLLCGVAPPVRAQSVSLPDKVAVDIGRLGQVKVTWSGDDVKWVCDPGLDVFREYTTDPAVVSLRVIGYRAGTYPVQAIACKGGKLSDFAVCLVVVGTPVPPTPPTPPVPPTPPTPDDPLTADLRVLYAADPGADKASNLDKLTAIYRNLGPTVDDTDVATLGQLNAVLRKTFAARLPADALKGIRTRLGTELQTLGTLASTPLDTALRGKARALFALIAADLGKLAPPTPSSRRSR